MSDYRKLLVWQRAHELNLRVAQVAPLMRGGTLASLRNQMIRAAHSIPSNIVEGRGQKSEKQFASFLRIAINSSSELEYHLQTAHDMRAVERREWLQLEKEVVEVRKMLYGLVSRLESPE
ncbi:MAG: four helix bundle protein [Gemmatimonas sp.]